MEISFTSEYGTVESVVKNVYKPIIDLLQITIRQQFIDASINRFRNELLLPEVCNPRFVGFNTRYNMVDTFRRLKFEKYPFFKLYKKKDIPVVIPSLPIPKTTFHKHFLEIDNSYILS